MTLESDAEQPLAVATRATKVAEPAVHVGGVEERDPGVKCRVYDGSCALLVEAGAEVVAADTDDGDGRAAFAEGAVPHDPLPKPMQTFLICV